MSIGYSDIWVGGGVDQGLVGTVLTKVLLRWMPSRLSRVVVAAVSADRTSMAKPPMWTTSLAHHDIHQEDINASRFKKEIQNFDRRLLSTILDSGTRLYMPGMRATSRVERAIMLLTALKPDRKGAERARLLNKEQRRPFVVTHSVSQRSDFLRNTHHQVNGKKSFALSARVPSFERDRPPGAPPLVTPQLNGGPARRAVNKSNYYYRR